MSYNTKQKEKILEIIQNTEDEFTIKDIYEKLDKKVGLTTIYRLIDKLIKDNIVIKTIDENNESHYQYLEKCECDNHFYLKCDICKNVKHIDCDCIKELYDHIINEHQFKLNKEKIIINGICQKCVRSVK